MDLYIPDAPDYFLVTFGFPRRDIISERAKTPTLAQALHMINGETLLKKVESPENVMAGWLKDGLRDDQIIDSIYQRAYARLPSDKERTAVREFIQSEEEAGRSRRGAFDGVLWTLINSKEFQVNH